MHRYLAHILLLCSIPGALQAQSGKVRPAPHWGEGQIRRAEVTATTHMVMLDTISMDISGRSSYLLQVVQARKEGYILSVRMDENSDLLKGLEMTSEGLPSPAMDSAMAIVRTMMEGLYRPLMGLDMRFTVSPQGQVLERIDTEEEQGKTKEALREATLGMMKAFASKTNAPRPDLPIDKVDHMVDSMYGAFVQVQVNELNYLLRPYDNTFPTTGSVRTPILVHDVDAPMYPDMADIPAMQELGLDSNTPEELVCRTIVTYDPDALYAAFEKRSSAAIERGGLQLTEETVDRVDRRSGWITSSTSVTTLRSTKLTVTTVSKTVLKTVR